VTPDLCAHAHHMRLCFRVFYIIKASHMVVLQRAGKELGPSPRRVPLKEKDEKKVRLHTQVTASAVHLGAAAGAWGGRAFTVRFRNYSNRVASDFRAWEIVCRYE